MRRWSTPCPIAEAIDVEVGWGLAEASWLMLNGQRRSRCRHRNGWLCTPHYRCSRQSQRYEQGTPRSGYRGSDFVLWHRAEDFGGTTTSAAIRGTRDVPRTSVRCPHLTLTCPCPGQDAPFIGTVPGCGDAESGEA